jgi:hypothetical protein
MGWAGVDSRPSPQCMCATPVARPGKSRDRSQAAGATEDGFGSIPTCGAYPWSGGVSIMADKDPRGCACQGAAEHSGHRPRMPRRAGIIWT